MNAFIEQSIKKIIELQKSGDVESSHMMADAILCEVLTSLGHSDLVEEYHKVEKWFS